TGVQTCALPILRGERAAAPDGAARAARGTRGRHHGRAPAVRGLGSAARTLGRHPVLRIRRRRPRPGPGLGPPVGGRRARGVRVLLPCCRGPTAGVTHRAADRGSLGHPDRRRSTAVPRRRGRTVARWSGATRAGTGLSSTTILRTAAPPTRTTTAWDNHHGAQSESRT